MRTLREAAAALDAGVTSSTELTEICLERIADTAGEGAAAFIRVDAQGARIQADAMDRLRTAGAEPSPWAGIPIALKDLFDVRGQVTAAGSRVLADAPAALQDAPIVARLRRAGFVILGRNNMTEFAYSGLGLNPHYGTPKNPFDRAAGRIPGGSSSGGGVSVADAMAFAAIGTDTGGSCRIPAAMCGITGYKPTQARIPLGGTVPLSTSFDSIGTLANSVACCAALDAVLSGDDTTTPAPLCLNQLNLGVPRSYVFDDVDEHVGSHFEAALGTLSKAGVKITEFDFAELDNLPVLQAQGGIASAEAFAWHRNLIEARGSEYDPRVAIRILRGKEQTATDHIGLLNARRTMIAAADAAALAFNAVIMPTVPVETPTIASLADDDEYARQNLLALRNPALANFLDRCAISLPLDTADQAPVGLMLMGETRGDRDLFAAALAVEACLRN